MNENERIIVVVVKGDDVDDEEEKGSGPRPNAYWQRVREGQEEEPDNYGGSYRGVKAAPHGGQATVKPEDTIGSDDDCWCGKPAGHDWPGKAQGRKHPKEEAMKVIAGTLDRRDLRAYHQRLQDFVLQCVNDDELRYRMAKNSVILYPPDGTAPATVYARNSDRQVRQLQKWYLAHVLPSIEAEQAKQESKTPATPEELAALAAAKNDPSEHPAKRTRPTKSTELPAEASTTVDRPPVAPTEDKAAEPPAEQPTEGTEQTQQDVQRQRATVAEGYPSSGTRHVGKRRRDYLAEIQAENRRVGEWRPYIRSDADAGPSPNIETNGTHIRCKLCIDTDHPLMSDNPRSAGGHNRIYHTDAKETLWNKETRKRAAKTVKEQHNRERLEEAVALIAKVLGADNPLTKIDALEKEVAALKKRLDAKPAVKDQSAEVAALTKRAEEAEARLALMREALSA